MFQKESKKVKRHMNPIGEGEFTPLEMLYADHVMRGLRTIESVPAIIRERVQAIIDLSISK